MDAVSSVFAAVQVIAEISNLIQKLLDAQAAARELPEFLDGHRKHLANLQKALQLIGGERHLQTEAVISQVQELYNICQELHEYLETRTQILRKNTARRYIHALRSRKRDEKEIRGIIRRFKSAKIVLDAAIEVAKSATMGIMSEDLAVTRSVVQRIETRVPGTDDDAGHIDKKELGGSKSLGVGISPALTPTNPPVISVIYQGISSDGDAMQLNGDIGSATWQHPLIAEYRTIQARGKSVQINGRTDLQAFQALMATRQ